MNSMIHGLSDGLDRVDLLVLTAEGSGVALLGLQAVSFTPREAVKGSVGDLLPEDGIPLRNVRDAAPGVLKRLSELLADYSSIPRLDPDFDGMLPSAG